MPGTMHHARPRSQPLTPSTGGSAIVCQRECTKLDAVARASECVVCLESVREQLLPRCVSECARCVPHRSEGGWVA